jgi:hypothetical protein
MVKASYYVTGPSMYTWKELWPLRRDPEPDFHCRFAKSVLLLYRFLSGEGRAVSGGVLLLKRHIQRSSSR